MPDLDLSDLPEDDDLLVSARQALAGETTYLHLGGRVIAAIVPEYVAQEHDEDISAEVAGAGVEDDASALAP
jgi:hypothetical protein